jgi:hypothetical protein
MIQDCLDRHLLLRLIGCIFFLACRTAERSQPSPTPWQGWAVDQMFDSTSAQAMRQIGRIAGLHVHQRGEVSVLDAQSQRLFILSSAGTLVDSAARAGDGPGEFRDPVDLVVLSDTLLLVFELSGRLHRFSLGSTGLHLLDSRSLGFSTRAACALGSQIYILGERADGHLHEVSPEGDVLRSFKPMEEAMADSAAGEQQWLRAERTSGLLLCHAEERLLVHVPEYRGRIDVISSEGSLLWQYDLPGFVPPVRGFSSGGVRLDVDPAKGFSSRTVSGASISASHVVINTLQSYPRQLLREAEWQVFVVDLRARRVVAAPAASPRFLGRSPSVAISMTEDPEPHLEVWRPPSR